MYLVELSVIDMETNFHNCNPFQHHAMIKGARPIVCQLSNINTSFRMTVHLIMTNNRTIQTCQPVESLTTIINLLEGSKSKQGTL